LVIVLLLRPWAGFGIIFDTFRNSELNHVHKDVALYINNGNEALDPASMKDVTGCDSDFRYWEGRDDFGVANKSVAKITLKVWRDGFLCGSALGVRV
jgi:hypothetical protein